MVVPLRPPKTVMGGCPWRYKFSVHKKRAVPRRASIYESRNKNNTIAPDLHEPALEGVTPPRSPPQGHSLKRTSSWKRKVIGPLNQPRCKQTHLVAPNLQPTPSASHCLARTYPNLPAIAPLPPRKHAPSCVLSRAQISRSPAVPACFLAASIRRSMRSIFTPDVRTSPCISSCSCAALCSASALIAVPALISSIRRAHGGVPETWPSLV
jgi:hypothetical protein